MRLQVLDNGFRPLQKVLLTIVSATSEGHIPGPIAVMSYHRDLFGKYLAPCFQEAMRKATEWSVAEVELFAAFVSRLNKCNF
jgi:hypothetical protein